MNRLLSIRYWRSITGFALLGTVTAGAFFGWRDFGFDVRAVGACLGLVVGIVIENRKSAHADD